MITKIIHWSAYGYYLYLFAKASILKITQDNGMMEGMAALGFNKRWTLAIGYAELIGVVGLLAGLLIHESKNAAVLFLFPFSVGALMVHFAHGDYNDYYDALFCTILSVVLLVTDEHFSVSL